MMLHLPDEGSWTSGGAVASGHWVLLRPNDSVGVGFLRSIAR